MCIRDSNISNNASQTNINNRNNRNGNGVAKRQLPGVGALYEGVESSILDKISKVSAKHRSQVYEVLSEVERNTRLNFTRVYPAAGCDHYEQFFEQPRPSN